MSFERRTVSSTKVETRCLCKTNMASCRLRDFDAQPLCWVRCGFIELAVQGTVFGVL